MCMVLCCIISSILGDSMDLDGLIRRHDEGLSLIHSIKAKIEVRVSEGPGQTWKTINESSVLRSGEYERDSWRAYFAATSGYPDGKIVPGGAFKDSLTTPEGQRSMVYSWCGPEDVPSGTIDVGELASQGKGISGQIDPPQPFVRPLGYKSGWLLPLLFTPNWQFTLRELCTDSHPHLIKGKNAQGEPTYDLDVTDPTRIRRYSLSFDPAHNYLITHFKVFEVPEVKGKPIEWFNNLSVVDFHEPKKGIFVPKTIRGSSENIPGRVYETLVSDVVVNEPFDDEKLHHLEFPPGILVVDATQEPNCFYVWGDGKPAMTFHSLGAVNGWRLDKMAAFARRSRHPDGWTGTVVWVAVATLALAGVLWIRRVVQRRLNPV